MSDNIPQIEVETNLALTKRSGSNGKYGEIGTSGIQSWAGYIREAVHSELRWPAVYPLFDRLRRSDPETTIARGVFTSLGRSVDIRWQGPEDPTPDDVLALEFAESIFDDMEGGIERWRDALLSYVPFHGWGWWEIVAAPRIPTWKPPDKNDPWRSKNDDGRIGVRSLAWRDQSSFFAWDMDDATGRLMGLKQFDIPNKPVTIPLNRSVHVIYGDTESPEGLSPLETVWRLERVKYGLELVQGIGFEHSAGYLDVTSENRQLSPEDKAIIREVARSVTAVQEGNYAAWPKGLSGELKDVNFSAADSIMEAIRYFGLLKLQVFAVSWVAMATTAKTGSLATTQDISGMFIKIYNAMVEGFVSQLDDQLGEWIFKVNEGSFPGMTERPKIVATKIEKELDLAALGSFGQAFAALFPMGEDDVLALRRRSNFLPEILPEDDIRDKPEPPAPIEPEEEIEEEEEEETEEEEDETDEEQEDENDEKDLALRPMVVSKDERPLDVRYQARITEKDIRTAVNALKRSKDTDPRLVAWLDAEVLPGEEET